jgi:hypothetical protein
VQSKIAIGALLATAVTLSAHHAFTAEYDITKPVTVTGTVTRLDWANPHSHLYLEGKDDKGGGSATWSFELGGPLMLGHLGWTRDSVKPGDHVKVYGFRAKDGSKVGNGRIITFADGHTLHSKSGEYKGSK